MIEKQTLQKRNEKSKKTRSAGTWRSPVLLAFFLTGLLLTVMYIVLQFYPFGGHSVIISDLGAQYAPYLVAYKNQLLSGGGLTYSFLIGMGKNTLGLFAYYLSSPLNFVTFLFPSHLIAEAVLVLIGLKLSLASAFMTLFLRSRFHTSSYFSVIFGILYAFSSYVMVYMINIMWLDGLFLLPLLLFFIDQFLENRAHWWRVTLTLLVLFVSGFYIAYMVGIFSFLYLLGRLFADGAFSGDEKKKSGKTVLLFIGSTALAAGLSAALLLPAGMDILGNPDRSANTIALTSNFSFVDFLNQFLAGSFDTLSNNKPLVYCGLLVFLLCGLFFLNPYFSRRQKGLAAGAMIFFTMSFNLSFLNFAWQLFDSPNWFQYRYSFLLVFVFLVTAFASLLHVRELKPRAFVTIGLVFLAVLIIVQKSGDLAEEGDRFYMNLMMGILQLGCVYALSGVAFHASIANLKKLIPALLVIIVCIEVVIVNPLNMRPKMFGGETKREPLVSAILQAEPLVQQAKADEKQLGTVFFRMETNGRLLDSLDEVGAGLYLGYSSVSTFNSSSNKDLNRFLKQLGFDTNYNYFASSHGYTSVVADSLLGVRYILSDEKEIVGYERIGASSQDEIYLYRNHSSLPLLYLVNGDAGSFDFFSLERNPEQKNPFEFQNHLLASLFGEENFSSPVFSKANTSGPVLYNSIEYVPLPKKQEEILSISESLAKKIDTDQLGEEPTGVQGKYETEYLRISKSDAISLSYTIDITSTDPLFMSIPAVVRNDESDIYVNGKYKDNLSSSSFTRILSLGSFSPGDKVEVTVRANSDTYSSLPALFYYCDTALFEKQLSSAVSGQDVQMIEVNNGQVSAQVTVEENQLLLTTIPYEKGWTLRVDGEKTTIVPYQNALISIPLAPGTHTIELSFTPPGMWGGILVTCVTVLVFSFAMVLTYRKRSPKE